MWLRKFKRGTWEEAISLPISPKENNTKYSSVKLKPKATCKEKRRYLAFDRWTGLTNGRVRHG